VTEERIKEIERWYEIRGYSLKDVIAFIRTVAAEARKEGIEEMYEWSVVVTQAHPGLEPELRMRADQLKEKP